MQRRKKDPCIRGEQHQPWSRGDNISREAREDNKCKKCANCGGKLAQSRDQCLAHGLERRNCGKANHWARVRRSKPKRETHSRHRENPRGHSRSRTRDRRNQKQSPTSRDLSDQFEAIAFGSISANAIKLSRDEVFATVNVKLQPNDNRRTALRTKLDTDAQGISYP